MNATIGCDVIGELCDGQITFDEVAVFTAERQVVIAVRAASGEWLQMLERACEFGEGDVAVKAHVRSCLP